MNNRVKRTNLNNIGGWIWIVKRAKFTALGKKCDPSRDPSKTPKRTFLIVNDWKGAKQSDAEKDSKY